jgi:hypothetical protein
VSVYRSSVMRCGLRSLGRGDATLSRGAFDGPAGEFVDLYLAVLFAQDVDELSESCLFGRRAGDGHHGDRTGICLSNYGLGLAIVIGSRVRVDGEEIGPWRRVRAGDR